VIIAAGTRLLVLDGEVAPDHTRTGLWIYELDP
jgi:hypothetical protein